MAESPLPRNKTFLNRILGQRPIAQHVLGQIVGLGLVGFNDSAIAVGLPSAVLHRLGHMPNATELFWRSYHLIAIVPNLGNREKGCYDWKLTRPSNNARDITNL